MQNKWVPQERAKLELFKRFNALAFAYCYFQIIQRRYSSNRNKTVDKSINLIKNREAEYVNKEAS